MNSPCVGEELPLSIPDIFAELAGKVVHYNFWGYLHVSVQAVKRVFTTLVLWDNGRSKRETMRAKETDKHGVST